MMDRLFYIFYNQILASGEKYYLKETTIMVMVLLSSILTIDLYLLLEIFFEIDYRPFYKLLIYYLYFDDLR